MPRAALSIDFEFFQHAPAYRSASGTADMPALGRKAIPFLLKTLEDADATATFFIVSEIADSHPNLIERVATGGHEVASHTHTHRHLSDISPTSRREEFVHSKERLEAFTDTAIEGFRAPSFDITADHFRMLAETGYTYDSSVVPCRSIPGWYGGEFKIQAPSQASVVNEGAPTNVAEVPVGVMPGLRLPLSGTWLRFFGVAYTIAGMRLLARKGITPVLYVHPWELVDLPNIDGVPNRIYFRNGAYMRRAVKRILDQPFDFVPVGELAAAVDTVRTGTNVDE